MSVRRQRGGSPHPDVLTPGEWRVVEGVRHGMGNRQIARRRRISADAVKYHVQNALLKLALPGRAALRHWTGIRLDNALYAKGSDMKQPGMLGAIGQISRKVADVAAARV